MRTDQVWNGVGGLMGMEEVWRQGECPQWKTE